MAAATKRVLYLALYPLDTAPSQRFRVEQYLPHWEKAGIAVDILPFYDAATFSRLYERGNTGQKIVGVLRGFWGRLKALGMLKKYDFILVQRGATPAGPPFIEWIATKILGKSLIYDFDDAIWIPDPKSSRPVKMIKNYGKVKHLCRWASKVSVGNAYLAGYARQYNKNTVVIPTVVDTETRYVPQKNNIPDKKLVIGWTGSHSTVRYLDILKEVLPELAEAFTFKLIIISNGFPSWHLPNQTNIRWNQAKEIRDLQQLDIGIMPLTEDAWSRGKCGFKAIQYMALGIPTVASPVGVNTTIIEHQTDGFLAKDKKDWLSFLSTLLKDKVTRERLGNKARNKIRQHYSIHAQLGQTISLFESSEV